MWPSPTTVFTFCCIFWVPSQLAASPQTQANYRDQQTEDDGSESESGEEELTDETLGHGLPIFPGYTQVRSDVEGGYVSAPGCPMSLHGYPWVQFGNPAKCFLVGLRGPCNEGMKMGFRRNVLLSGFCKCDGCDDRPSELDEGHCPVWDDRRDSIRKMVANWQEHDRCYELYTRGPCPGGQIFSVKDVNSFPTCSRSRCRPRAMATRQRQYPNGPPQVFDPTTSQCLTIGESCRPVAVGRRRERVEYYEYVWKSDTVIPSCERIKSYGGNSAATFVSGSDCPERHIFSRMLQRCIRPLSVSRIVG